MNIISWNLGLTCEKFRKIFMGIKCNIKTSVDKISTKILKFDADVYMFQEVMYGFNRLNENITKTYPYHFYVEYLGLAVFSKTPINPITYTLLPKDWFNYILGFSNGYMISYLPEHNKYVCNIHFSILPDTNESLNLTASTSITSTSHIQLCHVHGINI